MSPHHALREYAHKLATYELKEIMEYPEVWFLGDAKKVEGMVGAAHNAGTYIRTVCGGCGVGGMPSQQPRHEDY